MTEPSDPGQAIADGLATAIETMLNDWPTAQKSAKITIEMTENQWTELLYVLRVYEPNKEQ